jgi:4-amino-4-deoxy-L-arabinose transferase-like glycosyltransferase
MHILEGLGHHHEQSSIYPHPYDHPYFGQYFLAGMLAIVGYPASLNLSSSSSAPGADVNTIHSIEMLYLIPRVLMGVLAVFDTFLLYKIGERRYNRTVALIASILFAVMPITWLLRKILLESLLLPLLLSSILFALYTKDQKRDYNIKTNKNILIILLSGVFLGLAILTKIPIFIMIPLVAYLVYTSSNKNWRILGIWFTPVLLIPLIWPVDSILIGDFDLWIRDVVWHTERQTTSDSPIATTLLNSLKYLFQIEPVLLILGIAGIIFAEIKRDFMLLLWVIPFLIFLFIIDFVSFFHSIITCILYCCC